MELVEHPARVLQPLPERGVLGRREEAHGDPAAGHAEPQLAVLDETDSGLDIDALRTVADGVNTFAGPDMGVLIITHYQRILHLVEPDFVHVMYEGRIVKQGGPELVALLEERGYGWIREEVEAAACARGVRPWQPLRRHRPPAPARSTRSAPSSRSWSGA